MGIALTVLGIILLIVAVALSNNVSDKAELIGYFCTMVGGVLLVIGLLIVLWASMGVIKGRTYEQKITMYQEENKKIESQVDVVVQKYMAHEDSTFKTAKNESAMTLVALYPELKSDSLVKEQIRIFNKNNEKIKSLKEDQIDVSTAKFWLYFGK